MAFNWGSVDWGSVAGAAASIYSSNQAARASRNAGNAAAQGSEAATALARDIYNDQRALNMPLYNAEIAARNQYNALLGLPPVSTGAGGAPGTGAVGASGPTQWFNGERGVKPNYQLYATDPRYRAAWDSIERQQRQRYGEGFNNNSTQRGWIDRLQQAYWSQPNPQAPQTGGPGQQTPAQTPAQAQQAAFAQFRNTPGYQFGLTEGAGRVQASAAARGGLLSGATLRALQRFGNDYADQQGFTPYVNRIAAAAGIGQTNPVGNLTSAAGNYGNSAGQFMQNAANARASGILTGAAARSRGMQQAGGFLQDAWGYYQNGGGQ